mmetsp:Transcript_33511/g.75754  ORF Transcript_33511/g.75754 Transcript_33511/m.75754 type:complete len:535 (-) Transcript_33511:448-2052(-)
MASFMAFWASSSAPVPCSTSRATAAPTAALASPPLAADVVASWASLRASAASCCALVSSSRARWAPSRASCCRRCSLPTNSPYSFSCALSWALSFSRSAIEASLSLASPSSASSLAASSLACATASLSCRPAPSAHSSYLFSAAVHRSWSLPTSSARRLEASRSAAAAPRSRSTSARVRWRRAASVPSWACPSWPLPVRWWRLAASPLAALASASATTARSSAAVNASAPRWISSLALSSCRSLDSASAAASLARSLASSSPAAEDSPLPPPGAAEAEETAPLALGVPAVVVFEKGAIAGVAEAGGAGVALVQLSGADPGPSEGRGDGREEAAGVMGSEAAAMMAAAAAAAAAEEGLLDAAADLTRSSSLWAWWASARAARAARRSSDACCLAKPSLSRSSSHSDRRALFWRSAPATSGALLGCSKAGRRRAKRLWLRRHDRRTSDPTQLRRSAVSASESGASPSPLLRLRSPASPPAPPSSSSSSSSPSSEGATASSASRSTSGALRATRMCRSDAAATARRRDDTVKPAEAL